METKLCVRCNKEKPASLEFFYRGKNGFRSWCKSCQSAYSKEKRRIGEYRENHNKWGKENRVKMNAYKTKHANKVKLKAFCHYSKSDIPFCNCCGTDIQSFLTLDHINNDGADERKLKRRTGKNLCAFLVKEGLPSGFQVLCYNCNCAKTRENICLGHNKYIGNSDSELKM